MKQLLSIQAIFILFLAGCAGEAQEASSKLKVFVSIPPQAYFVERVGGERVEVNVLVKPGRSPHSYEPTPRQMSELAYARVYFTIGVPFEKALAGKIENSYRNLAVVETHSGVRRQPEAQTHRHEEEEHGDEDAIDPHIWLDPGNVKIIASNICRALKRFHPEHSGEFDGNLAAFHRELDELDGKIRALLAPHRGKRFYVFHPAFGYFAKAYGLEQAAVEFEGKEPGARQLTALIEKAKDDGARVIFMEPQFAKSSAEAIAREIGAGVGIINPLAKDYMKNLEDMAEKIKEALTTGATSNGERNHDR